VVTMPGCEEFPTLEVEKLGAGNQSAAKGFCGLGSAGEEDHGS
jgi:hypothetical protein